MTWHVVARVGPADSYSPTIDAQSPRLVAVYDDPAHPAHVRNDVLQRIRDQLGVPPPPLAVDLLHLAMTVYSADLRVNRIHGSGRWTRDFALHLPVSNVERWESAAPILVRMLQFLTGDRWRVEFRPRASGSTERQGQLGATGIQAVSLFSGGLDSLVGAIDLLASGNSVALVAHHGAGMANSFQANVLNGLRPTYGALLTPLMFYVQPPRSESDDGEKSMRSRSVLFLSLGAAVAATLGSGQSLVVAENGLISINVPLTPSRTGSSSTRTTHPHFLALFRDLLSTLGLGVPLEIPYRFFTKGEMLRRCVAQDVLRDVAPLTMSCSHPEAGRFRGHSPGDHCV